MTVMDRAVQTAVTEHGAEFNQIINITGANGRVIDVTFGWIRNHGGVVRLPTGIPTKKMRKKFHEYDVVKSRRPLDGCVPAGALGAILMVFDGDEPNYEVEFVDNAGESLAVLTVSEADLEFVGRASWSDLRIQYWID